MYKLDLEKAEEPEIQHPLDNRKSKRVPEISLLLLIEYTKAFDCVNHSKLWNSLNETGIANHITCLPRKL